MHNSLFNFRTITLLWLISVVNVDIKAQICQTNEKNFCNVKLVSVYDGDTFKVHIPASHPIFGKSISVRVNGIDTPELRTKDKCEKKMASQAKIFARKYLLNAKKIDLLNCKRGKYFRLVCDVNFDEKSYSAEFIKTKLAYEYFGGTKRKINWCKPLNEI